MVDDVPQLTAVDFARAIPRSQRERLLRGQIDLGGHRCPSSIHRSVKQRLRKR